MHVYNCMCMCISVQLNIHTHAHFTLYTQSFAFACVNGNGIIYHTVSVCMCLHFTRRVAHLLRKNALNSFSIEIGNDGGGSLFAQVLLNWLCSVVVVCLKYA